MRRRRPWLEIDEIERITEAALRNAGLWPDTPRVRVDIERFVELSLGAIVDYGVDLDRQTLGFTILGKPPRVIVNRTLTELANGSDAPLGLRGRWRATLAHEAAHLLLHAGYFDGQTPVQRGRLDIDTATTEPYDWREVQANMGMAALLMPRRPFLSLARDVLDRDKPAFPPLDPESVSAKLLVSQLAEAFETSHQATRLRLVLFGLLRGDD